MKVEFTGKSKKQFLKQDKPIKLQIQKFIAKLQEYENQRLTGKALVGNLAGFWRYRVGDYKLICRIRDDKSSLMSGTEKIFMTNKAK